MSEQQPSQEALNRFAQLYQDNDISRCGACESQVWGIPWSEEAFIEQMVHFGHPATVKAGFPEELQDAVDFYRCKGLHERVEYRASRLGFWLRRLHALKADEAKLKASLDKDVAIVMKQKNILLWEEMLKSIDYPDMSVVSELRDGTDLVGCTPKTGLWPSKFQPASITLDELHDIACKERSCLSQQFAGVCEGALIEQVCNKTTEEVDAGALVGPIHLEDIPTNYPLSRRFGIQQGMKLRCIDDFSRSSVNASVQTSESPKPHTIDAFAAMCVHLMSSLSETEQWVGRTFDLVGAYRQCAVRHSSAKYSHILVQKPETQELFAFRMRALPFGSIRSVHAFLRISHSIRYILVKEFRILVTNYFDDYISLSPGSEAGAITSCIHLCFRMLGWAFAESGDKAPEFSTIFSALGVFIDVTSLHSGRVLLGNTESRRHELVETLKAIMESGRMTKQEALRLRGRLQFTSGFLFGRIAKSCLAAVSNHAYSSSTSAVSCDLMLSLSLHKRLLEAGKPRELRQSSADTWFIQTDACFDLDGESVVAGVGAVLFAPDGRPVKFFSHKLSDEMVRTLNPTNKKSAIFECEFFALFCAFWLWGDVIIDAVVIYTDNNGVRDALNVVQGMQSQSRFLQQLWFLKVQNKSLHGMPGYLLTQTYQMVHHVFLAIK